MPSNADKPILFMSFSSVTLRFLSGVIKSWNNSRTLISLLHGSKLLVPNRYLAGAEVPGDCGLRISLKIKVGPVLAGFSYLDNHIQVPPLSLLFERKCLSSTVRIDNKCGTGAGHGASNCERH